ncbi:MAG: HD domain-containing protein [Clostridia bacterium]|nr:HD domain-containing protein [Clostridia bacterium]
MISYDMIRTNPDIRAYISAADASLEALGYTEHSFAHVTHAAEVAADILSRLGYDGHTVELAKIAGFLHDIGNLVNRVDHSQSGAIIAFRLLDRLGMPAEDIADIVSAIGNHDEGTGVAVNPIAAALILADKTDVRRSRVRNTDATTFDIHDRVNYSVEKSEVLLDTEKKTLALILTVDVGIGSVMDYFEIFLGRMVMCRKAAERLGLTFTLEINRQRLL